MLKLPFYAFGIDLPVTQKDTLKSRKSLFFHHNVNICEATVDRFVRCYRGKMLLKNVALNLQIAQLTEDILAELEELSPRLRESALKRLCVFHRVDEWWAYPQQVIRGKFISDPLWKALRNRWFYLWCCSHFEISFFFISRHSEKCSQVCGSGEKSSNNKAVKLVHLMCRAFFFSFNIYSRSKEKSRFKDSREMMKLNICGDVISNSVDLPHASVRGAKSKTMDFCHITKAKIDSKILFLFFLTIPMSRHRNA